MYSESNQYISKIMLLSQKYIYPETSAWYLVWDTLVQQPIFKKIDSNIRNGGNFMKLIITFYKSGFQLIDVKNDNYPFFVFYNILSRQKCIYFYQQYINTTIPKYIQKQILNYDELYICGYNGSNCIMKYTNKKISLIFNTNNFMQFKLGTDVDYFLNNPDRVDNWCIYNGGTFRKFNTFTDMRDNMKHFKENYICYKN